jgi:hypothetical protein
MKKLASGPSGTLLEPEFSFGSLLLPHPRLV